MQTWPMLATWEDCHGRTHSEVAVRLLALTEGDADGDAARWSVGRRDRALLDFRERWLGRDLELRIACPACDERLELEIATDELRREVEATASIHELDVGPFVASYRVPTSHDVAVAMLEPTLERRRRSLWRSCVVVRRHGAVVDDSTLPAELVDQIERTMAELDAQAVTSVPLVCPECEHAWDAAFDIVPVLWAEVDAHMRQRLWQVHELAAAYGWSEQEILALGPQRLAFYLEQV